MNSIEKQNLIKKEKLNQAQYFQSILQEACLLKLLTDAEFENIQLQTIQLLARQTERYTGGESSSVKVETAQDILQSVFFTIGICLKSFPDTDMSIKILKQKPLTELHKHGKKLIQEQLDMAKQLLNAVQKDMIATDNHAYNDTIENGISMFFSVYDADFAAHETPGSIDYPLGSDQMDLAGIEYIYSYLQKLFWENRFCKSFTEYDIFCLLRGYDEHYQDLLVNISGLVLTNAVGSVLAGKNGHQLNIEPSDRLYLQEKLAGVPEDELETMLHGALTLLFREFNISDALLQEYMTAALKDLPARIGNALQNNCLNLVFISMQESRIQPVLQFEDGRKMDDELFRSIAEEIRQCRYVSDKTALIKREIHSITDLVDILEGSCIFANEFFAVFQSLGDTELALLLKRLPMHEADSDLHFTENEKEWHNELNCFLKEMDPTRREYIRESSKKIGSD